MDAGDQLAEIVDGEQADPMAFAVSDEQLLSLRVSPWLGHIDLGFPEGAEIHPGVFDSVAAVLRGRPYYTHSQGSSVYVALKVLDKDPEAERLLASIADELADSMANAAVLDIEITHQKPRTQLERPDHPVSLVPPIGDAK